MGMKITFGFEIDNILNHEINEEKAQIFVNFDKASLNKMVKYCYSNTVYKCWGRDECYYCTITKFVHEELRVRKRIREKNGY